MDEAEFDKFADQYNATHAKNISIFGEKPEYFAEYKVKDILSAYEEYHNAATTPSILDFGSGIGTSVPFVRRHIPGARLRCLDISQKSLGIGRRRYADVADFVRFDGRHIPFSNESFDLVFGACVFHHIDEAEHVGILREFLRILVPGGLAIIYEHNPYNPLTYHAVKTCPFDENACLISARQIRTRFVRAGFSDSVIRYRVFFPASLRLLRPLERWLVHLPVGAQYYVAAQKKE